MPYDFKLKKLPKSEVEIEVSLPSEMLGKARPKALKKFGGAINVDGFRKGNVPERIVLEKLGERAILEEATEIVLNEHYPKILAEAKIDTIGRPAISITKLALGNPLEFKVRIAILPEFELPEFKRLAKDIIAKERNKDEKIEVEEKEVDEVLLQIRKNKAILDKKEELPELNDEFAKQAGNFQNLDELKTKIKENILNGKKVREIEKRRAAIMEALLKATDMDLPEILIESETEKSLTRFKDDITRMGGKWEDYLAHTKKSEDELRKDLQESSEKRAKIQLIFNKIVMKEKLEPNKEILEHEVAQILEHHKEAREENVRIFVATQLLNQEVLRLLEQQ